MRPTTSQGAPARTAARLTTASANGISLEAADLGQRSQASNSNTEDPMSSTATVAPIMSSQQFLEHWQGHRALTRRTIDVFPEKELFSFSIGGMRPFSELAMEFLGMAVPTLNGVITGTWAPYAEAKATTKAELLRMWDAATAEINTLWSRIPAPLSGGGYRVRTVENVGLRAAALRQGQRDPSSRSGLRLPPIARHRTAAVLGARLTARSRVAY